MIRGRPKKYKDEDLEKKLIKVKTKHVDKDITPTLLEQETGINRFVWQRRMREQIDKLNKAPVIFPHNVEAGDQPNIVDTVRKFIKKPPPKLISALAHWDEVLNNLYSQAIALTHANNKIKELEKQVEQRDERISHLEESISQMNKTQLSDAVKSAFHDSGQGKSDNIISMQRNPKDSSTFQLLKKHGVDNLFEKSQKDPKK